MKRGRRLLLAFVLAAPLALWLASPRFRAAVYEQAFRLGPEATRAWCLDRLAALGADGAPCLISLIDYKVGGDEGIELQRRIEGALTKWRAESLPALAGGLLDPRREVRLHSAWLLDQTALPSIKLEWVKARKLRGPISYPIVPRSFGSCAAKLRALYEPLIPILLRGLEDPEDEVRDCCFRVLCSLPESANRALPQALRDIRAAENFLAASARAMVWRAGDAAVPALKDRLPVFLDELENRPPRSKLVSEEEDFLYTPNISEDSVGGGESGTVILPPLFFLKAGGRLVPFNKDPLASVTAFTLEFLSEHDEVRAVDLARALKIPQPELRLVLVRILAKRSDGEAIVDRAGLSAEESVELREEVCDVQMFSEPERGSALSLEEE